VSELREEDDEVEVTGLGGEGDENCAHRRAG
jgi:hypothetical protein